MVTNEDVVSVIVPIYNAMPYFKECLASICNQTYTKFTLFAFSNIQQFANILVCHYQI